MDLGQTARRWGRSLKAGLLGLRAQAHETAVAAGAGVGTATGAHHFPRWSRIAIGLIVVIVLYYPLRACWVDTIDDNPRFWPARVDQGQSTGVAMMAALIDREVNDHDWTVNSPGFTPSGMLLDDMPNFQRGLIAGVARFAPILKDRIGRAGFVIDPDLGMAADHLSYPPDVWLWDWQNSIWPSGSSGGEYQDAMTALTRYNARLAQRKALFYATPANFALMLDAVGGDLDDAANLIDAKIAGTAGPSPSEAFYRIKGRVYAEYVILAAFAKDFESVINARGEMPLWNRMMADLKAAATIRSGAVRGGSPGVVPSPCDLCTQGFFIMRARGMMGRIAATLRKP